MKFSIVLIVIITSLINHSIQLDKNESSAVIYDNDYELETSENTENELDINTNNDTATDHPDTITTDWTFFENEEENSKELCSIDSVLDQLIPKDYEEGKLLNISSRVPHINETFGRIDRIIKLFTNYTNNLSPITQKLMARLSSFIYEISLPHDCLASVALIADAISNRQLWALKCKSYRP